MGGGKGSRGRFPWLPEQERRGVERESNVLLPLTFHTTQAGVVGEGGEGRGRVQRHYIFKSFFFNFIDILVGRERKRRGGHRVEKVFTDCSNF